jgi:hypothetical protein
MHRFPTREGYPIAPLRPSLIDGFVTRRCYSADGGYEDKFEVPLDGYSRPQGTGAAETPAGAVERVQSIGGDVLALTSKGLEDR